MKNKKGQGMTTETLVILLAAIAVGVLIVLGFMTNWFGLGGKIGAYTGGNNLADVSTACKAVCPIAESNSKTYCESDLKVVNKLELAQLNNLKTLLTNQNYKCMQKDKKTIEDATGACDNANKGIWYSTTKPEGLNYYSSQAKVTCGTLAKAGLIDGCPNVIC